MPPSPELVERSADLKRALVAFGESRRYARQLDEAIQRAVDDAGTADQNTVINAIDHFLFQHRLPDGRTVVEVYVDQHPELSDEDRATLLGWRDIVEGIFEVERRDGDAVIATNLLDELTYRLHSNTGPTVFDRMPPGSFILTRIAPLADEWMLSGMTSFYPAAHRDEMYRVAADAVQRRPRIMFRNPKKLAEAWEMQRKERALFVDFFGSDFLILPAHEAEERLQAFRRFQLYDARDAHGNTNADQWRTAYGVEPVEVSAKLPPALTGGETVGVIYDQEDGLSFWPDLGLLDEAFANPDLVARGKHRRAVLSYLDSPGISPVPLRRLAERDPARASRVFAQVLKRPTFSWERDGDALLRERKVSYFVQPPIPSIIPLSDRLTRATLDQIEPNTRHKKQPARKPARRAARSRKRQ
jgi:hypothetical protein